MAKKPTILTELLKKNHYEIKASVRKSKAWFEQQILILQGRRITPNKLLNASGSKLTSRIELGKMYLFKYDPKGKKELPYYDAYPLIFPFADAEGGFLGLNLHYLPYKLRFVLLNSLLEYSVYSKDSDRKKLDFSWSQIKGVTKYAAAKPCIKHYLISHIKSQFLEVPGDEWGSVLLMPLERFKKATKEQVWKDSIRNSK